MASTVILDLEVISSGCFVTFYVCFSGCLADHCACVSPGEILYILPKLATMLCSWHVIALVAKPWRDRDQDIIDSGCLADHCACVSPGEILYILPKLATMSVLCSWHVHCLGCLGQGHLVVRTGMTQAGSPEPIEH